MKLTKFNTINCITTRTVTPTLSTNRGGVFSLNKATCDELKLKEGERIALLQDDDSPEDWYITIDKTEGFELRKNDAGYGMTFNNKTLRQKWVEAFELDEDTTYMYSIQTTPIKEDKQTLFLILTATASEYKRKIKK